MNILDNSVILKNAKNKAAVYKAAHHGAKSGYSDEVWDRLIEKDAITIVAPFTAHKEPLPTRSDIMLIEKRTKNGFLTSTPYEVPKIQGRHPQVQKSIKIRAPGRNLRCLERGLGHIQLRSLINKKTDWSIEKNGEAVSIAELKKTVKWVTDSMTD